MDGPHEYPDDWSAGDWVVPTSQGHAVIRHGHTNPDDHSACGPTLFCCARSARLFARAHPESPESNAQWQLIDAGTILAWVDGGVRVVYFVFCDPEVDTRLRAVGITAEGDVRKVIQKSLPIERFADEADPLDVLPQDDVIFRLLQER